MILTLIRGLPGAGKSMMARALAQYTGAVWAEADMYFMRGDEYKFDPADLPAAHEFCLNVVRTAFDMGRGAVVSNTFTRKWEMQPYVDMAMKLEIPVQIVTVEAFPQLGNDHEVPPNTIKAMGERWERFDPHTAFKYSAHYLGGNP